MNLNYIYNADCMEILSQIEDKSVDLVFTDPPYNVKKKYNGYDDSLGGIEYLHWMSRVVLECRRIARRGVLFYVAGNLLDWYLGVLLPSSHVIVVHKRAAGITKDNYMQQYHVILSTAKPIIKCKDLWDDIRLPGEGYFFREPRYDNPGMTSEKMIEKVLYHFTLEGETILDPFMGCGATAEACIRMKRNYVGIEQSKKYCEIAEERIRNIE